MTCMTIYTITRFDTLSCSAFRAHSTKWAPDLPPTSHSKLYRRYVHTQVVTLRLQSFAMTSHHRDSGNLRRSILLPVDVKWPLRWWSCRRRVWLCRWGRGAGVEWEGWWRVRRRAARCCCGQRPMKRIHPEPALSRDRPAPALPPSLPPACHAVPACFPGGRARHRLKTIKAL